MKNNQKINEGFISNIVMKKVMAMRMDDVQVLLRKKMKDDPQNKDKYMQQIKQVQMSVYDENGDTRSAKDMAANIRAMGEDKNFRKFMADSSKNIEKLKNDNKDEYWDLWEENDGDESIWNNKKFNKEVKEFSKGQKERTKNMENAVKTSRKKADVKEPSKDGKEGEVTDPKTGKKKKVVLQTGKRGGRFYYPEGKPKTPENKVYVDRNGKIKESLTSRLIVSLNE